MDDLTIYETEIIVVKMDEESIFLILICLMKQVLKRQKKLIFLIFKKGENNYGSNN